MRKVRAIHAECVLNSLFEYRALTVHLQNTVFGCFAGSEDVKRGGLLYFFECVSPIAGEYLGRYLCFHFHLPPRVIARDFYIL